MYINNNISGPKSDSIYRFDNQKTGETQRTDHSTHNVLLEKDCCMDFDRCSIVNCPPRENDPGTVYNIVKCPGDDLL